MSDNKSVKTGTMTESQDKLKHSHRELLETLKKTRQGYHSIAGALCAADTGAMRDAIAEIDAVISRAEGVVDE